MFGSEYSLIFQIDTDKEKWETGKEMQKEMRVMDMYVNNDFT